MTRMEKVVMAGCFSVLAGVALADRGSSGCVEWTTEARSIGFAYNHLVHLDNQCDEEMACDVWTDVNPDIHTVELDPEERMTITTFVGSPSREFEAVVECEEAQ